MSLLALPSFVAILAKLQLFLQARRQLISNASLTTLLVALLVLNGVEFSSYFLTAAEKLSSVWMMRLYYFSAVVAAAALLDLCLLSAVRQAKAYRIGALCLAYVVCIAAAAPGVVVAGIEPIGEFTRRLAGPSIYYWSAYIATALSVGLVLLVYGLKSAPNAESKRRCKALLVGLTPLGLSTIVLVILMQLGIRINGSLIISVMSTLLVMVIIYCDSRYGLFKFMSRVPYTEEYKRRRRINSIVSDLQQVVMTSGQEARYKSLLKDIEKEAIDLAVIAHDGNKSRTAKALGISGMTLSRKTSLVK